MELPNDLYQWLQNAKVLSEDDVKSQQNEKVTLEKNASQQIEMGLKMPQLLAYLSQRNKLETINKIPELDSLKDSSTAAARLFNWNTIVKAIDLYGIKIDDDSKSLIVAGDHQMLSDLLNQLKATDSKSDSQGEDKTKIKVFQQHHQPTGKSGKSKITQSNALIYIRNREPRH